MDLMLRRSQDTFAGAVRLPNRMKGTVPADGLEPSQTRFQRPVGCQLPYAGRRHLKDRRSDASTIPSHPRMLALLPLLSQRSLTGWLRSGDSSLGNAQG